MQKNTKGFAGAVVIALLTIALMVLCAGAMLTDYFGGVTEPFLTGVILFCAALCLAVAVGVAAALHQRWREIQGGEEDEASQY